MLAAVALASIADLAHADPEPHPNAVYVEGLGKGGVWGLGFERALSSRIGLGAVASYAVLDGTQQLFALAPYGSLRVLGHRHRWFVDLGPEFVYLHTPSPVVEWTGTSSSGVGGELSSGYEYRDRFVFRVYAELVGGTQQNHNLEPWLGLGIGWTF